MNVELRLTPHGRLVLSPSDSAPPLEAARAERLGRAFERGSGHGLLALGAGEVGSVLPPVFAYWRELGARYVTLVCTQPTIEGQGAFEPPEPPLERELEAIAAAAPLMPGAEYVTAARLRELWGELGLAFASELRESGASLQGFLRGLSPAWNLVGRVHFNLAENRRDEEAPFAFLATYTSRLSADGKAQHLPLGQALRESAGATDKARLLSLLLPVQRAAERCGWLRALVDSGELFHPLRWSAGEASRLLGDAHELGQAGVVVRLPEAWRAGRPPRPKVAGTVGSRTAMGLGKDALLDFRAEVTLDGEPLTPGEVRALLGGASGLAFLRGRWVEVDRERLERSLQRFQEAERLAAQRGLGFAEAMRLLAGAEIASTDESGRADPDWSEVRAGPWLAQALEGLRSPGGLADVDPGPALVGTLRPYQRVGVRWLQLLSRLGLGACLADDMGLGKTIQLLALLLIQRAAGAEPRPSLLVAPASLLANWTAEAQRFAPSLRLLVAHPSELSPAELKSMAPKTVAGVDLVVTSYGSLLRLPWLQSTSWRLVILDEAQAIKNPGAKQTRAVKQLSARARIALTGTPVENRIEDLWSIFDFTNPGLLGTAKEFAGYAKRLSSSAGNPYGPLRDLVRPYVLRRLKTDARVIQDLPAKTEVKAYCRLARKQAALYAEAVEDLSEQLELAEGMKRRGLILAFLMRLKQICNHPSQWLGDGGWAEGESGKWARLRELTEVIAAKQEKALVFTQFREVTAPLASFLGGLFGRPGLVLHGEVPVKQRRELVRRFQEDEAVPFFVLSLKAGGSGLNLTAASHVIHFDRWWNPAVEDQATDRAFRIGQKRNVLVHKLVCKGTVEEKIDVMIESKRQLSRDLLEGGAELNLTELGNEELMALVKLDLRAALEE
ncbi:MAG: DEAD/DEAH box helicase [Deltaproteobacteria bacterium]